MAILFDKLIKKVKKENEQEVLNAQHKENYDKVLKLIEIYDMASGFLDKEKVNFYRQKVSNSIIQVIDSDPELLKVDREDKDDVSKKVVDRRMFDVISRILDEKEACCRIDRDGYTIGHYIAWLEYYNNSPNRKVLAGLQLKALDNHKLSTIQDFKGMNMGMCIASANCGCNEGEIDEVLAKALSNKEASLQQDDIGYNMGMYCASNKLKNPTLFALQNKEACEQTNYRDDTIESFTFKNFKYLESSEKIQTIREKFYENKINSIIEDFSFDDDTGNCNDCAEM